MINKTCVIVGASHAGVSLALQLRREGWQGKIKLIGDEDTLPYHRPPLSKDLFAGKKNLNEIRLRPAKLYEDNEIELTLGITVNSIDRNSRSIELSCGKSMDFDFLALCTGAKAIKMPRVEKFRNIFSIRTANDVNKMGPEIAKGNQALVIGGGYIGLEVASVLIKQGLDVVVIELSNRILQRVSGEKMSAYLTELHESNGVRLLTGVSVSQFEGNDQVTAVVCSDGSRIDVDFVVVGIGILPETSLAEKCGLKVEDGVVVDQFGCTSDPAIYAAGDCASHPNELYGRQLRLESVQNANDQARAVASNICGKQVAYNSVPWFWSDQYEVKLQMVGLSEGHDEIICRGNPDSANTQGFALFYLKNGLVIASECIGRPKEFMLSKRLIGERIKIEKSSLSDELIAPSEWVS